MFNKCDLVDDTEKSLPKKQVLESKKLIQEKKIIDINIDQQFSNIQFDGNLDDDDVDDGENVEKKKDTAK